MNADTFTPGDRVQDRDGRTGTVKSVDWGGVYVEMDAAEGMGRELRVCRGLDLVNRGSADA